MDKLFSSAEDPTSGKWLVDAAPNFAEAGLHRWSQPHHEMLVLIDTGIGSVSSPLVWKIVVILRGRAAIQMIPVIRPGYSRLLEQDRRSMDKPAWRFLRACITILGSAWRLIASQQALMTRCADETLGLWLPICLPENFELTGSLLRL